MRVLPDCSAASRTMLCHRLSLASARPAAALGMLRRHSTGTKVEMPSSVPFWSTISNFSPLRMPWNRVTDTPGSPLRNDSRTTSPSSRDGDTLLSSTTHSRPEPSISAMLSPSANPEHLRGLPCDRAFHDGAPVADAAGVHEEPVHG